MGVLCSVNAISTTISCTNGTSTYYIDVDDVYSESLILTEFENADWYIEAPVIIGYNGTRWYFESESDLIRSLCVIYPLYSPDLVLGGDFRAYSNGKEILWTTIYSMSDGSLAGNFEIPEGSLVYGCIRSHGWTSSTYKLDGVGLVSSSTTSYFGSKVVGTEFGFTSVASGGSLTVFQPVTFLEGTSESVLLLHEYPDFGNISIYAEPESDVYEGANLLGTTDNGGFLALQLPIGNHDLKFVKDEYWDCYETITISVEDETELFVSLSPKSSIFQVSKEFSGSLYPNSVGTLSMDINPVKDAYAAKLRVSGVEVNKVYYQTHEIPKAADGSYILGDVTSTQNIEIEFKTPSSWGEKTFAVEISATDIEGTAYTNLETIDYEVLELPFLLEMPETFGIGINDITLTDQSGTAYSVLMVLYDSNDVEVWSSSTNLLEYCDYTFEVPVNDAGDYTLELNAKAGTVKTYYSIDIIEPITLITEEINVNPGKVATVQFKISNPTSSVKYYTAELTCPFFNESINKTFSIAPGTVYKTVDISFEVPEGLELENYQLILEISDPDKLEPIYSGNVVLTISKESLIFASVPGGNTTLILLAAAVLLIVGTFAALRLKK